MRVQLEGEDEPVEVDPEQVEVDDDDPFLTQEEVDGVVQKRLNRERRKLLSSVGLDPSQFRDGDGNFDLSELDEDTAFRQLAEAQGIELREDGQPKGSVSDEKVQELRQKASKVESLQEQLSEYEERIDSVRETELENQLLSNADRVTDKDLYLSYAKSQFTHDDEYGWVKTDQDGNVEFEGGEPITPDDYGERFVDEHPSLAADPGMSDGPSSTPEDGPSSPDQVPKSKFDQMSPEKQKQVALDEGTEIVPD